MESIVCFSCCQPFSPRNKDQHFCSPECKKDYNVREHARTTRIKNAVGSVQIKQNYKFFVPYKPVSPPPDGIPMDKRGECVIRFPSGFYYHPEQDVDGCWHGASFVGVKQGAKVYIKWRAELLISEHKFLEGCVLEDVTRHNSF